MRFCNLCNQKWNWGWMKLYFGMQIV
jgi:hypothetical protein